MSSKKKTEHGDPAQEPETAEKTPETPETAQAEAEPQAAPAPAAEPQPEKPQADSERYLRLMAEFDNYK